MKQRKTSILLLWVVLFAVLAVALLLIAGMSGLNPFYNDYAEPTRVVSPQNNVVTTPPAPTTIDPTVVPVTIPDPTVTARDLVSDGLDDARVNRLNAEIQLLENQRLNASGDDQARIDQQIIEKENERDYPPLNSPE